MINIYVGSVMERLSITVTEHDIPLRTLSIFFLMFVKVDDAEVFDFESVLLLSLGTFCSLLITHIFSVSDVCS